MHSNTKVSSTKFLIFTLIFIASAAYFINFYFNTKESIPKSRAEEELQTITVCPEKGDKCDFFGNDGIAEAIESTSNKDWFFGKDKKAVINVKAGTYTPTKSIDVLKNIKYEINGEGSNKTIINGKNVAQLFHIYGDTNVGISGFKMTGGQHSAIYSTSNASISIFDNEISFHDNGDGIFVNNDPRTGAVPYANIYRNDFIANNVAIRIHVKAVNISLENNTFTRSEEAAILVENISSDKIIKAYFNTFYDNATHFIIGGGAVGELKNNILYKHSNYEVKSQDRFTGRLTVTDNIYQGDLNFFCNGNITCSSNTKIENPQFIDPDNKTNPNFHYKKGSPLIGKKVGAYPEDKGEQDKTPASVPAKATTTTGTTTIAIVEVYNAKEPNEESFQLYNMTKGQLTLTGWSVCNQSKCFTIPTTSIEASSIANIRAPILTGWNGLDRNNDMLVLLDQSGKPVDSLNWGIPVKTWTNYAKLTTVWNPGLKIPTPTEDHPMDNPLMGRRGPDNDTNEVKNWIVTERKNLAQPQPAPQAGNDSPNVPSTTIEITDVRDAVDPQEEWFQLYNMTAKSMDLDGWSICSKDTCSELPKTTIESRSLAKFKAPNLTGWPQKGLDPMGDMLGLKNNSGVIIDSMNWGVPLRDWKNYETFKDVIWNPAINPPNSVQDQSFFRMALGKDANKPTDWLTTSFKVTSSIAITDVYNATKASDEWFQLYNMTTEQRTLTGWSICSKDDCISIPTTTINSKSVAKIKANSLTGWPTTGLDGAKDMLGLRNSNGDIMDSVNWGKPSSNWKNYEQFKGVLWDPGVKPPNPAVHQSFSRKTIEKDEDKPTEWVTTSSQTRTTTTGTKIISIVEVYNATKPNEESFQLYNMTNGQLTLTGYSVCAQSSCATIPETTIEAYSRVNIRTVALNGWKGLDGANDMFVLLNESGKPIDSLNWGTPQESWTNYKKMTTIDGKAQTVLTPGLEVDGSKDQIMARLGEDVDTNQAKDWVVTQPKPLANSGTAPQTGDAKASNTPSNTIEITDVYNDIQPEKEWFQIYNMTKGQLTLTGWSICTKDICMPLPTTTIETFSLAKFKAPSFTDWPQKGLDGTNDMLAIKDQNGKIIDTVNWGAPFEDWKNYPAFKDVLWNPGVTPPNPTANQSIFRMAIGKDADKPEDWITTSSPPPAPSTCTRTIAEDIECDGKVDEKDLMKWKLAYTNFYVSASQIDQSKVEDYRKGILDAADINKDGKMNMADFVLLRSAILK